MCVCVYVCVFVCVCVCFNNKAFNFWTIQTFFLS